MTSYHYITMGVFIERKWLVTMVMACSDPIQKVRVSVMLTFFKKQSHMCVYVGDLKQVYTVTSCVYTCIYLFLV